MEKFFVATKKTLSDVGSLFREAAHDATYDFRDNVLRGCGLPRLVVSAASLSVAGCAAVGTLAITCELISKVHVRRDCKKCNGFGGFKCTMCSGAGQMQYSTPNLLKMKGSSIENLAQDLLEGKEEIVNYPPDYNVGYPLPYRKCPTCSGTGVSTCQLCKGYLSEPRLCFANLMNLPWKTWNAHRRAPPPENKRLSEIVKDPVLAHFLLLERHEIEGGFTIEEDVKERVMASYERNLVYDEIRDEVATRPAGWEQLQEALYCLDSERAKRDPVVIQDVPHYKALKKIEAEVALLAVPPRPADWTEKVEPLLRSKYGGNDEESSFLCRNEIKTLVQERENLIEQVLDAAWANDWRQRKVKEVVHDKIRPFIEADQPGQTPVKKRLSTDDERSATSEIKRTDAKVAAKKSDKSQKADKKKERQERLAKQAAEREAALAKAKKK